MTGLGFPPVPVAKPKALLLPFLAHSNLDIPTSDAAHQSEPRALLLTHGADASIKNKEGKTAADIAEKRGLYDAAELLRNAGLRACLSP